jgi:hypothetical protein
MSIAATKRPPGSSLAAYGASSEIEQSCAGSFRPFLRRTHRKTRRLPQHRLFLLSYNRSRARICVRGSWCWLAPLDTAVFSCQQTEAAGEAGGQACAMGNHSRRSRLRYFVAGALLGNADTALAFGALHNFLCVRRPSFMDRSARSRAAMACGRGPHCRPSTGNNRAVSLRSSSHLRVYAVHFVRHGISFGALVVIHSVDSVFHCRYGNWSAHRREITRVSFRRAVRRIQAPRSGLYSVSQVVRSLCNQRGNTSAIGFPALETSAG